jgi:hypothetical protein
VTVQETARRGMKDRPLLREAVVWH